MPYKYLAKIIIEATTAFHVGSGQYNYEKGSLVQTDWNLLPYIQGTSIAGMLRHGLGIADEDNDFGFSKKATNNNELAGRASNFIFSSGLLLGKNNQATEAITNISEPEEDIRKLYLNLPSRDFVAIDHYTGTAKQMAFHAREMVFKGSRFGFLIEFSSDEADSLVWRNLLAYLDNDNTRLGGGSRKGFGAFKIVEIKHDILDLENSTQRQTYLDQTFSLNDEKWSMLSNTVVPTPSENFKKTEDWETLKLNIEPNFNTLIFGAGVGNDKADATQKKEKVIAWDNNIPSVTEEYLLAGSSVKGAIRHRIIQLDEEKEKDDSLHKKIKDIYENEKDPVVALERFEVLLKEIEQGKVQEQPSAIAKELFGYIKDKETAIGNVIVEDTYIPVEDCYLKVFSHVAIDRFTGAPIDGALFQEEVIIPKKGFTIEIKVNTSKVGQKSVDALNEALQEIADGVLPIGGMTNKGHGVLSGDVEPLILKPKNAA